MTAAFRFCSILLGLAIVLPCGRAASSRQLLQTPVILTAAGDYDALAALHGGERFPRGARLLIFRNGITQPLVSDFADSADASVSFDGTAVLFAGKRHRTDPWQIWELTLAGGGLRQVTSSERDTIRPLYLPGRRMVFARRDVSGLFVLHAADLDGTHEVQLTYLPASAVPTDVLADGRILFASCYPLGNSGLPEMFLVYSDGSGVESYRCDHPQAAREARWGGHQLASGDVVFTHGETLARFTSPLAAEAVVTSPRLRYAEGGLEMPGGHWILSARAAGKEHFALWLWPLKTKVASAANAKPVALLSHPKEDLVQPVLLAARQRPHQHPSALHEWDYANLLALDARLSRDGAPTAVPRHVSLASRDEAGNIVQLGTAPVEPDGSFFIKVPADRPIRVSLLDEKGAVLRQERGWMWLRRGEQRICVGCHTGPERAAENRVPAVLLRSTVPVDLSGRDSTQPLQGSH